MSTAGVDTARAPEPAGPPGKLASQIARRIEADVLRRGWPVGESLGSEPQLRERFGVSRAVLREAVRLVEHHQVARMRRGPGGGLFVTAPDASPATRATVIYLEYVGTTVADLMHARSLIEPLAVALAAERITEEGIAGLRRALDDERAGPGPVTDPWAGNPLHVLLAGLSGNPVLELFVDVLTRLTNRYLHTAEISDPQDRAVALAHVLRHHAAIVDAVVAGDSSRAAARMGAYLDAASGWLGERRPDRPGPVDDRPAPAWAPAPDPAPAWAEPPDGERAKLAEVISSRIREEIVTRGWPVDTVLGSETELLARYRISRAVLREAVRLLEHHSVARMRRGPGGGLLVTRPDPQASIETIALHLEYRRVGGEDLRVVRDAIELGALERVLARADPAAEPLLRAAVAHVTDGPPGDPAKADVFHTELARLSGNPVLALFLRIITELFRRHTSVQDQPPPGDEAADEVRHVHERILAAVLDGDAGLARHRMRRHLEALVHWWH